MKHRALLAVCALAALTSGCRTLPVAPPTTAASWEARRAALQERQHFEVKGRVAVAAGQEGFTASLRWVQIGPTSQLSLDGPLGVGGVRVTTDGTVLTLVNPRGEHLDSDAARAELKTRLGFDAPLASLRYWILGVPDPASAPSAEIVDVERRLTTLEQNGWQIDYADYMVMNGEWLPGRMTLHRADVRVRLIVDHWDS
jgi:outer membrane lipoprotein LolB